MKVWLFPRAERRMRPISLTPRGHPVRFVSFVLGEVSSTKISRANDLLKNRLRRADPQITRLGDLRPGLFGGLEDCFMAKPSRCSRRQIVERSAETLRSANSIGKVQRQIVLSQSRPQPVLMPDQLAAARCPAGPASTRRSPLQDHHIVHKSR
jgi:hypothetical protein